MEQLRTMQAALPPTRRLVASRNADSLKLRAFDSDSLNSGAFEGPHFNDSVHQNESLPSQGGYGICLQWN